MRDDTSHDGSDGTTARAPIKAHWRSIAELVDSPEYRAAVAGEFPVGADLPPGGATGVSRRGFLELLGASLAFAGLTGCTRAPRQKILPYTQRPEGLVPGQPQYYATSMTIDGYATGLLVESHEGRPTKIEGNPDHPASLGGTGVVEQAAILSLYDPDRARAIRFRRGASAWEPLVAQLAQPRRDRGAALHVLLPPTSSPTVSAALGRLLRRHPEARVCFYAPLATGYAEAGAELALGRPLAPQHDVAQPDVIVSLDADFLGEGPLRLAHARRFASRRRMARATDRASRLYVVETMLTGTGSMADERLRRRPSQMVEVACALAANLAAFGAPLPSELRAIAESVGAAERAATQAMARDLWQSRRAGGGLVLVGDRQPPALHALALALNDAIGARGRSTWTTASALATVGDRGETIGELAAALAAGKVDTLLLLDVNPVYDAPADLELGRLVRTVPTSVCLSPYDHETAQAAAWLVPAAHFLESWGDGRAYDGTLTLCQPLIAPMHGGRTAAEILAAVAGDLHPDAHGLVRQQFLADGHGALDWEPALQKGFASGTAAPKVDAPLADGHGARIAEALRQLPAARRGPEVLELHLPPDRKLLDGRFANNAWLLELPDPITKLTWDNAALVSPATAKRLGLADEELVELTLPPSGDPLAPRRSVRAPVVVVPGHADDAVTLPLGWGRDGDETLARATGRNAYLLSTSAARFFAPDVKLARTGEHHQLARTQDHWSVRGREIVFHRTVEEWRREPDFAAEHKGPLPTLLPVIENPGDQPGDQWAMTIDTSICDGCAACEIACQAENNILVVGKEQVVKSREMHWLRIDTYHEGSVDDPRVVHQPMLCQHCEAAPCEYVCPVNATVHSADGLNEMVYNRCVGTRFCSNNCPYKVRRFNWFAWVGRAPNDTQVELQRNPEVSVRERGVMEKCTFCVQRIRNTEIRARLEEREIRPGEIQTACQQACPTGAIQFGSLRHKQTAMVAWRGEERSYSALHDLGTRPRVMYLAKISNPANGSGGGGEP